jgi:hypothetical protein
MIVRFSKHFLRNYFKAPKVVQRPSIKQEGCCSRIRSLRAKKYDEARYLWQPHVNYSNMGQGLYNAVCGSRFWNLLWNFTRGYNYGPRTCRHNPRHERAGSSQYVHGRSVGRGISLRYPNERFLNWRLGIGTFLAVKLSIFWLHGCHTFNASWS